VSSTSPAVGRALDVLVYLAAKSGPVAGAAIARDLKIPRSSTYHLLDVLAARGFVVHFGDERTYGLGMAAFEIGAAYLRHEPLEMLAPPIATTSTPTSTTGATNKKSRPKAGILCNR
jgi:IclR family transcriptional regulator, acetate operon repressor